MSPSPEYLTLARTLHPGDLWWAEHYTFLLSRGYQLRKRFKPGWVPSWELPGNHPWPSAYEDFQPAPARGNVLDAVRITDGVKVVLKIVRTRNEADLTIYFGNTLRESEPSAARANRAVPVLEVISTPYETLIVLPFLREFLRLPFVRIGEVTEALRQFLRGMQYMHSHNVAHRDLGPGNLMMDASRVVPKGWHMCAPDSHDLPILSTKLKSKPRYSVAPVSYYIIDFGLATQFPPSISVKDARSVGRFGQYWRDIPELSDTVPYNPFKVGIFMLGNVIKTFLVEEYHGLDVFRGLGERMTATNPDERPSASECLDMFERLVSGINPRCPVIARDSGSERKRKFRFRSLLKRFVS
ncbi:kinase domain-containing protein [Favolaschia claudopus]|uniref:Kinase domain-containing protein n=1 Tax=Favolaschia claudopus TaxID=2862362 RepID=A0AAW0AEF4_9AGAR